MNNTLNIKGLNYDIFDIEQVYIQKGTQEEYVNRLLKTYILSFKYERMNMCMFNRSYNKCTIKQLNYISNILDNKFDYELSDKQFKFLSKCSINEISILINRFKNMEITLLSEHDFKRDEEGNITY